MRRLLSLFSSISIHPIPLLLSLLKMESKLQSLKVAELKTLLTNASLPVSGVKADLIARLLENPSAIQHLQDPSNTTQEQPTTSSSTTTTTEISPTQTPTQETPASAPPVKTDEEKHQELIAELEKRKARAKRFGTTDSDAEAKLERALKFGVGFDQDKALNQLDAGLGGPSKKVGGQKPPTSVSVDGNKTQTDVRSGGTKKEEKKQETVSCNVSRQVAFFRIDGDGEEVCALYCMYKQASYFFSGNRMVSRILPLNKLIAIFVIPRTTSVSISHSFSSSIFSSPLTRVLLIQRRRKKQLGFKSKKQRKLRVRREQRGSVS